jgi:hypothetical protein
MRGTEERITMPTFDTPEPITVALELRIADVRIDASDRHDTVVEVRPTDPGKRADTTAAEHTTIGFANGTVLIRSPNGWRKWAPWGDHGSIQVRIEAPAGSAMHGQAGVANLGATGHLGEVRYHAGVGDVELEHTDRAEIRCGAGGITVDAIAGRAEIKTAGSIRIGSIEGPAVIKNANGDTRIGEIAGDARLNASNGSIVVDLARSSVVAKSANGDIRIDEVTQGTVMAQTAMGAIEIGVREGVPAWLDLATRFGNVRNELENAERPSMDAEAVEVRANTSMGDVTIRRSLATGRRDP